MAKFFPSRGEPSEHRSLVSYRERDAGLLRTASEFFELAAPASDRLLPEKAIYAMFGRFKKKQSSVPRVIFFDAAGTLFHLPRGVGHHYAAVLGRHGVKREEEALDCAFREVWLDVLPPANTKGARPDDDKGWWRDLVNRVLDRTGVAESEVQRGPFFEELYQEFVRPAVWTLYPETREVLEVLAMRFPLGVITNFDGRYRKIADQLGIAHFFRHVVISSEVGADKPDPRIFLHAAKVAACKPAEALHVGDDEKCDWEGAAAAGLRVFKLDRPKNSLREILDSLAV